jgi:hypothetical protein
MGQIADAAQNPNTFAPQPSGFSGAEWATRLGGGALKGLGQGVNNYQQQNAAMRQGSGGGMAPMPQAQMVDPSYFAPMQQPQKRGPNNLNFYGGGS